MTNTRRVALITGANRGLGFEVGRILAASGYSVWLGVRDIDRGTKAIERLSEQGLHATALQLDVTSDDSVRRAAARLSNEAGHLDVLVNNAGIALDAGTSPTDLDLDQVRAMFETNVLGCIRTTQIMLPLLRRSTAGRVVMVSSDIGSHTHQTDPSFPHYDINPMGYGASKAALNAVTIAFSKELRSSPIKVNAANPGFTATDLNDYRGLLTVEQGAAPIVVLATLPDDGPTGSFLGPDGPEPW